MSMLVNSEDYLKTIEQIKVEIKSAQYRAVVNANREMILLYHSIGEVINTHKVWGNGFVESFQV